MQIKIIYIKKICDCVFIKTIFFSVSGKLVSESVLRHCDQNHRIGPETVTFCDRNR